MTSKKKIIFLILLFLICFLIFSSVMFVLADGNDEATDEKRPLEIEYPAILSISLKSVGVGLPDYVKYIFNFAVIISGFIIFSLLVYNGFVYLTSAGDPTKISQAKNGLLNSFIGVIVLLASVFIFQTINPQLVQLETAALPPTRPMGLPPGYYICNYNVNNLKEIDIKKILEDYLKGDTNVREEAAKKLFSIVDDGQGNICQRISGSGPLGFDITNKGNTIFIVPYEEASSTETGEISYIYRDNFGVILMEKANHKGKCFLHFSYQEKKQDEYQIIAGTYAEVTTDKFNYTAHSLIYFEKPNITQEAAAQGGVTLFTCPGGS
ncbi:MAG: pilin, partial [Minisyncoccales bacterium]